MGIVILIACRTGTIFFSRFLGKRSNKQALSSRHKGEGGFAARIIEGQSGYRHDVLSKKHYSVVVLLLYLIAW